MEHRSDELRRRRWVLELDRGGEREKTGLGWSFIGGRLWRIRKGAGRSGEILALSK